MRSIAVPVVALLLMIMTARPVLGDEPTVASPEAVRQSIEKGLQFVVEDVVAWRKEKQCATCHHGTMTVWALSEARSQGFEVKDETLADVTAWTKERHLKDLDKPRDTRPGWSMVNTPALYLELMAQSVPKQEAITAEDRTRITGHLLRHQETDGSWAWSSAPPKNRPPPHFESDEVATLIGLLDVEARLPAEATEASPVRDAHAKATAWLAAATPTDTNQSVGLRVLLQSRASGPDSPELQAALNAYLARQNPDGGWSQVKDVPSDAYATGQALYYAGLAGAKRDRAEIQRGVAWLVGHQQENGSWAMTRRSHPGVTPSGYIVPITYFGTAWATMGLMRSALPTP